MLIRKAVQAARNLGHTARIILMEVAAQVARPRLAMRDIICPAARVPDVQAIRRQAPITRHLDALAIPDTPPTARITEAQAQRHRRAAAV